MRRFWTGLAMAISLAAITAGGVVISQDGGGDPPGTANLWVESGEGSCTRSSTAVDYATSASPDARCGSLDQAYDAANASASASTVLIKAGSYAGQSVTGSRSSSSRIVFDVAEGETVTFDGLVQFGVGTEGSQPGEGPDYIDFHNLTTGLQTDGWEHEGVNRFGVYVLPGSSNLRFYDMTQGGFLIQSSQNIEFHGGSFGPCKAPAQEAFWPPGTTQSGGCELNKVDHSTCQGFHADCDPPADILIDGVEFHDYDYTQACYDQDPGGTPPNGTDTCHHRSMFINGVDGFTLRNSTFRHSVFQPWTTISGPAAGGVGNQDVLIENNQFGSQVFYDGDNFAGTPSEAAVWGAHCDSASQPSYRNIIVRFNSFARWSVVGVPGNSNDSFDDDCETTDFKVYGNIFGAIGAGAYCGSSASVLWRYNIYAGTPDGTCGGTGEVNLDRSDATMPFYTDDDQAPEPGDYELTGSTGSYDNLVPADDANYPCPSTDANGDARPSGAGQFCDAGAFER